ncbi:hypothetical protein [Pantoea phytobeneficialis]|uniref:Uncharacterized protein n=1 Tax=Pantoea phytobeneficialis TaxID=2052056 RepID=A0AAP9HAF6_9GAMM|nr:hypothetical protein [Pantoea phytobeneficialis]MDO6407421.1 hypothetical protein [Pantoea phytobeneficialis]QGR09532.1 hypothetical protein CTZ24_23995 [Pantoea phytobeneficialis]
MNTDNYFAYNGIGFYADQSVLSLVLKGNNLLIGSIRKITHAPWNKISSLIYDYLPTIQEKKEITAADFRGSKMGYEHHLDLKVAVKVMNSEKGRELRAQLFIPENEVKTFLQLEGIAGCVPLEENRAKYNQLLLLLEENNVFKKSTNATSPTGFTREEVLREFIFSFIETKVFTSEMMSAGLRYALIPAISWICPPVGTTIKFIDGFDLVRPLCQETTVDLEGLARHKRRQKIAKYKEKLQHASVTPTSASSRLDVNAPLLATGMTAAALALQAPQPGRNIVPIAGALTLVGASLMVGYQFLLSSQEVANNNGLILTDNERDVPLGSVSYGNRPPALDLHLNSTANSTCYDVVAKIRKLLHSSQSGIRLADEFSQFIFDENIDLRVKHAEKLITTMNVTEFTCQDRDQMNNLLIDIFQFCLLLPEVGRY